MTALELEELPIGPGQGRFDQVRGGKGDEHAASGAVAPLSPVPPPPEPEPELAPAITASWESKRLKKPLQIVVGKTVNWRMRARLGIETTAGLMSDEHAENIADPLAEILNRYEPTRALASRSAEIELGIAIYDYVQATAVRAGQDAHRAQLAERQQSRAAPPSPFELRTPTDPQEDDL